MTFPDRFQHSTVRGAPAGVAGGAAFRWRGRTRTQTFIEVVLAEEDMGITNNFLVELRLLSSGKGREGGIGRGV
jgi:hypothetical protein